MTFKQRWLRRGIWSIFALWLMLQLFFMSLIAQGGKGPIDFLAYARAAQALGEQRSPYGAGAESQAIWRLFHAREQALLHAPDQNARTALIGLYDAQPQQPGPYIYPPSLALFIGFFGVAGLSFGALTVLSIVIFSWLWLKTTRQHPAWLFLIIGSVEVLSTLQGGNAELILLCMALCSAWLLWHRHGLVAAPLIAVTVLIKPFYVLFFIAFAALLLVSPSPRRQTRKSLLAASGGSLLLIGLEMLHWGARLRGQTLGYIRHAFDYQWFALPATDQTPMSIWNRTPLQALISAGIDLSLAQSMALLLWAFCLLVTLWLCRHRQLTFPLAFAFALCLLYIGRPIGWTLLYLDLVLLGACWPLLARKHQYLLLIVTVGVVISRWWAFMLTAQGKGMPLMTLQSPLLPWETLGLLLGGWMVLLIYGTLKRAPTTCKVAGTRN